MNSIQIGQRIRKFRRQRGCTQEALAEAAELSPSYLSHIERGTKTASLTALERLTSVLEIGLDQLILEDFPETADAAIPELQELLDSSTVQERCFLCETVKAMKQSLRDNHLIP